MSLSKVWQHLNHVPLGHLVLQRHEPAHPPPSHARAFHMAIVSGRLHVHRGHGLIVLDTGQGADNLFSWIDWWLNFNCLCCSFLEWQNWLWMVWRRYRVVLYQGILIRRSEIYLLKVSDLRSLFGRGNCGYGLIQVILLGSFFLLGLDEFSLRSLEPRSIFKLLQPYPMLNILCSM